MNLAILVAVFMHPAVLSPGRMLLAWAECVVLLPLVLAIHESGHMLVARLLGMDVGSVTVGVGPRLWEGEIGGVPIQVNVMPLFGQAVVGLPTEAFARLRLWLAILGGPAANLGVMWLSVHYWEATRMLLGDSASVFWVFLNALIGAGNLVPRGSRRLGRSGRSDGLALLQIPWEPREKLRLYLAGASIARALHRYRRRNYTGARADCLLALTRDPSSDAARCLLSSCLASLDHFDESREIVAPVLDSGGPPIVVTWAKCNLAIAILLADDAQSRSTADRLSKEACDTFPCLLGARTVRAFVLTWIGDPESALRILDYVHFKRATPLERGEHAAAQALALRLLGRVDDADRYMAIARALKTEQLEILERVMPGAATDR